VPLLSDHATCPGGYLPAGQADLDHGRLANARDAELQTIAACRRVAVPWGLGTTTVRALSPPPGSAGCDGCLHHRVSGQVVDVLLIWLPKAP
jgi:hypothetical protein